MPKWKASYDSNRKCNSDWEKQFLWLKKGCFNGEAYCSRFCNCSITARHSSLVGHEGTGKHKKKAPPQGQHNLAVVRKPRNQPDVKTKKAESLTFF